MSKPSQTPNPDATIQEAILADATAEAGRIIKEAETAAKQRIAEVQELVKTQLAGWADRQRQRATSAGASLLGKAQSEAHMRVLDAKARLIATALSQAREKLEKERGTDQYRALIKGLIIAAGTQISGDALVVLARKEDHALISKLRGLATSISKVTGTKTTVTLGKQAIDARGGVLIQNKEGSITVDYRLKTLLERVEQQYRTTIAQILFPEDIENA